MLENIAISIAVTFAAGFPLSIYAGVIVARCYAFLNSLNQARSVILNIDKEWMYLQLTEKIPDASSPTGWRSVYFSDSIGGNHLFWQLMQIGLDLKEQGHWPAAQTVDSIAMELDGMREEFIEHATQAQGEASLDITVHVADWHRKLSKARPSTWMILRPWPRKRYEHMSCVSVDEETGEWCEETPENQK